MLVHICGEVKMDGRPDIIWRDVYVSVSVVCAIEGPKEAVEGCLTKRTAFFVAVYFFYLISDPDILSC